MVVHISASGEHLMGILGTINSTCSAVDQSAASEPAGHLASIHGDLPTSVVPAIPRSRVFQPDLLHNNLQLHGEVPPLPDASNLNYLLAINAYDE